MDDLRKLDKPAETDLLVAFSDLTLFSKYARAHTDREIFDVMAEYFEFVGGVIESAGGVLVKCMGDATLAVFPEEAADAGVKALMTLKAEGDRWAESKGLPCRHRIKAHFGTVTCGPIGAKEEKRFDVYGKAVNQTALMRTNGLALSPQAFRKLEPETRKLFKKHTPPVSYIPVEESHKD